MVASVFGLATEPWPAWAKPPTPEKATSQLLATEVLAARFVDPGVKVPLGNTLHEPVWETGSIPTVPGVTDLLVAGLPEMFWSVKPSTKEAVAEGVKAVKTRLAV